MTDLKELLDEAAGPEPAVTDTDLAADLSRGRRAVKRRRVLGIATGSVATAAVAGLGWSLLPAPPSATTPAAQPTSQLSTRAAEAAGRSSIPAGGFELVDTGNAARQSLLRAKLVQLVPSTVPYPGPVTCDLIPKGWAVRSEAGTPVLYDPNFPHPAKGREQKWRLFAEQHAQPAWRVEVMTVTDVAAPIKWNHATLRLFLGSCHRK
ncbi:hypothetical protein [Kribbella sp. NPDC048915]|uniref:hypothetical protein n=1 Tax=Kribbella sp. NPDC048915 TaxID=3155148 RepID=UPI0033F7376B